MWGMRRDLADRGGGDVPLVPPGSAYEMDCIVLFDASHGKSSKSDVNN